MGSCVAAIPVGRIQGLQNGQQNEYFKLKNLICYAQQILNL
jgi:hypothetical protein